jgi:Flp pilus assembly protein TadG
MRRQLDGRSPSGQATVELVLVLPVIVMALLLVLQVALVARSQVLVVDAAREGARAAAVDGSAAAAEAAASGTPGLVAARLAVEADVGGPGGDAVVTVRYRHETDVPLVGPLLGDPMLAARVVMRVEGRAP